MSVISPVSSDGGSARSTARRIRLERAHAELGDADPAGGLTVRSVARRWGWASHGQFTVAYQQRFGVRPSRTLRS